MLKILKSTKGETLIEGIASILVFTVLAASVTMMILLSMQITQKSTRDADIRQQEANAALTVESSAGIAVTTQPGAVELLIDEIAIEIPVSISTTKEFTAFEPSG